MTRLLPRRIVPRLAVLLLLAMAVTQFLNLHETLESEHHAHKGLVHSLIFEQVEAVLRLTDQMPADQRAEILERISLSDMCYSLTPAPLADHAPLQDDRLQDRLDSVLQLYSAAPARLQLSAGRNPACQRYDSVTGPHHAVPADHSHDFSSLILSVPLRDGTWLNAQASFVVPPLWNQDAVLSTLLMAGLSILVVFLVVGRETRSLRTLALAVEQFGRSQTVPRLPETGPAEVVALISAFNTMQERLTRFIQDRTRLLAAISHDLRTPLTSLRLKAELVDDPDLSEQIITTVEDMSTIVRSTLDFARHDVISEDSRETDLSSLTDSLIQDMAELGMDISFGDSPRLPVLCRTTALRRALRNLCENAVRYGHHARVHCRRDDGFAIAEIDDDGPGIPEERMADVLRPFVRLEESRNSATGGIGLGLSIASDIIAAHGGQLRLQNRSPGLRVSVILPLSDSGL